MSSSTIWRGRVLRLSLAVGVVAACWNAWSIYSAYAKDTANWLAITSSIECAAKADDQVLARHANEFGNINIKHVFCSGRDFLVSMAEIEEARSGTLALASPYRPYDLQQSISYGLLASIVTALCGVALSLLIKAARWVWG